MSSDGVFQNVKHDVAAIRIERVSFREEDGFGIIDGASRREVFADVSPIEANEVGNLFTLDIDNFQSLSLLHGEGNTTPWRDYLQAFHASLSGDRSSHGCIYDHCTARLRMLHQNR